MEKWDYTGFQEKMGNKTSWGFVTGRPSSDMSGIANELKASLGAHLLDWKTTAEEVKNDLQLEEEPAPFDKVVERMEQKVGDVLKAEKKPKFVFDSYAHDNVGAFLNWAQRWGTPEFAIVLAASDETIKALWLKANDGGEFNEEQQERVAKEGKDFEEVQNTICARYKEAADEGKMQLIQLNTNRSHETTVRDLLSNFQCKVLLVNHAKSY